MKFPQVLLIESFELRRRVEIANVAVQILVGIVMVIMLEVVNCVLCSLAALWNVCIQELLGKVEIVEAGLDLDGAPCLRRGRGNARNFNRSDRFSFGRGRAVKAEPPAEGRPHCCHVEYTAISTIARSIHRGLGIAWLVGRFLEILWALLLACWCGRRLLPVCLRPHGKQKRTVRAILSSP